MVGKKIGVQQGGNTVLFKALLKANGIAESSVTVVPVQYDPTVITTGQCEGYVAYITNEPILLQAKGFKTVTFLFADYKLPFTAETYTVLQSSIDSDRDKLKAFLVAEIKGWKDAVASPSGSAALAVNTFGKDQGLAVAEQTQEATAQNDLIVSADTKANGLFTMTEELQNETVAALTAAGTPVAADKLFDLSLLNEVYQENPDLKS
jgi:ABC-type nitrate/sulfonate/bicarbonate transport system substrate-binding protein